MSVFKIKYFNEKEELLRLEDVFMKNVGAAKRSASTMAPMGTESIGVYDIAEKLLARKEDGKWKNF